MRTAHAPIAGLVMLLAACPEPEQQVETKSAAEHGEFLFNDPSVSPAPGNKVSCADCHSVAEPRSGDSGAPLGGVVLRTSLWGAQRDRLLDAINDCRYYFMLASDSWSGEEAEARALYAYLETLPGSADAMPFTIGALADPGLGDATRGEPVYDAACARCHGARDTGIGALEPAAPVLPGEWLADHPPDQYTDVERRLVFVEKTRHGTFLGYGGRMPPFSLEVLSDSQLADLMAYMRLP